MVSFQTTETLQAREPDVDRIAAPAPVPLSASALRSVQPGLRAGSRSFVLLEEASLDPRELAAATAAALARSPFIHLHKPVRALEVATGAAGVTVNTTAGALQTGWFVDCTGAWSIPSVAGSCVPVHPRKGQILSVSIPPELSLTRVIRTSEVYIVPRLHGPRAGEAIVGATVEDRGFDVTVEKHAIAGLHSRAAALLPALASAPITRAWAGLRPATPDGLPVLGWTGERTLVAKGHFRNGILLAPATAQILADLITGGQPSVDLAPFAPGRAVSPLPGARASNHPSLSEDDATAVCDNGFIATL